MPENAATVFDISTLYQSQYEVLRANSPELLDRVYRLRYQVYCIENQFEDPDQNLGGRETDCDDNRAGHVLLIHRQSGEAAGTARVIFPERSQERPLPVERVLDRDGLRAFRRLPGESTGEISRFAVSKAFRRRRLADGYSGVSRLWKAEQRIMPCITFGLFCGILDICLDRGISHVSAVMEPALLRLLKRFGLHFAPVGGLIEYHGLRQPCVAPLHDLINHVRDESRLLWLYASKAMG
jgi:N-acyl amino acid synthase of PEP-CTERM/exosortase system